MKDMGIPSAVEKVLATLANAGFEGYLVGGAVRDLWLKRNVHDFDVATSATPDMVKQLFTTTLDTGIRHGTVTVVVGDHHIEVTTFRSEGPYLDHRRPAYVSFSSDLITDLSRRDFTMNAMAMSLDRRLIDPFNGQADLSRRQLRAVGNPALRFREDGLRLMRALRFAVSYDLEIEQRTRDAIETEAQSLAHVAKERIGHELLRILNHHWATYLSLLGYTRVWKVMGAPLSHLETAFRQLYGNMTDKTDALNAPTGIDALALLFVEMPDGSTIVKQMCKQLALGRETAARMYATCELARRLLDDAQEGWSAKVLFELQKEPAIRATDIAAWLRPAEATRIRAFSRRKLDEQPIWTSAELSIRGRDLVEIGMSGVVIGRTLRLALDRVLAGCVPNERAQLLAMVVREFATD